MEKMTKKQGYETLAEILSNTDIEEKDMLLDFISKEIASIETKAEKAKVRAAAKRAEGDELKETVKGLLTSEYQTISEITEQIDSDEVSKQKVTARLTQLVKDGVAEKAEAKFEGGKKLAVYHLVG